MASAEQGIADGHFQHLEAENPSQVYSVRPLEVQSDLISPNTVCCETGLQLPE
jgi:hypothetical protein